VRKDAIVKHLEDEYFRVRTTRQYEDWLDDATEMYSGRWAFRTFADYGFARLYVNEHLREMVDEGKLVYVGKTNAALRGILQLMASDIPEGGDELMGRMKDKLLDIANNLHDRDYILSLYELGLKDWVDAAREVMGETDATTDSDADTGDDSGAAANISRREEEAVSHN